jgi:hypothetical protein
MRDIKLTLSQDDSTYAADPNIEAQFMQMQSDGLLYYPLHTMPRQTRAGCLVYFIYDDHIAARAEAVDFVDGSQLPSPLYTYQGKGLPQPPAYVACKNLELVKKALLHRGFQGFRYVKPEEVQAFEDAFK